MTIDVHIDRLIVEGLSDRDARRTAAAIEHHLGALILAQGRPTVTDAATTDHVDAGTVTTTHSGQPRQIGARIAQAVYREAGR